MEGAESCMWGTRNTEDCDSGQESKNDCSGTFKCGSNIGWRLSLQKSDWVPRLDGGLASSLRNR